MDAKICDRCGVCYQPKRAYPIYKIYKKAIQLSTTAEPRFEEIDLCETCKESLKAWMDFYAGTKKPNQKESTQEDPWMKMSRSK